MRHFHSLALFPLLALLALSTLQLVLGFNAPAPAPQKAEYVRRLASRQMTRQKLVNRKTIKRALYPRQSSTPRTYPTCTGATTGGFASDYLGADVSGGAVAAENEAVCLDLCNQLAGCVGIFWYPGQARPCYRKTTNTENSRLVQNGPGNTAGAGAVLRGSCQSLESSFDAAKMSSCCNTASAYPTCPAASKAGYARFNQWDYTGYDMPPNNPRTNVAGERACIELCESVSGCIGVFYWPGSNSAAGSGACYLKNTNYGNTNFLDTTPAAQTPNSETSLQGTCNIMAARGISAEKMDDCCNTQG